MYFGLVHLSQPITSAAPAQMDFSTSLLGLLATSVGYGRSRTGLTGIWWGWDRYKFFGAGFTRRRECRNRPDFLSVARAFWVGHRSAKEVGFEE